jgi:thiamine biosynthesis lipoprotein
MNAFRIISCLVTILMIFSCSPGDRYVTVSGYAQGGVYSVKFNLNGRDGMVREDVQTIRDSIDAILVNIDNSLSGYNRKSLVSKFNDGDQISPDSLFLDIYARSYEIYDATSGAVDVAAAPLFDIWGFGFKSGNMPDDEMVRSVRSSCGMGRMVRDMSAAIGTDGVLSPDEMLVQRGEVLPSLNYNAVAQGYSCDVIAQYLYSLGVKDMMVNIGEIYCDGLNPSGNQWTVGIDRPVDGNNELGADVQAVFLVPSGPRGVVTSGNYRKFYVRDGKKYAHTIDPRTGYPVSHNLLSATVIAPNATLADAYATYCMVIGLEASKEFIESDPDLEACLIYDQDGEFCTWMSDGIHLR